MKMKCKISNRILSLVLALVMVLSMLPMTAYAAAETSAFEPTRKEDAYSEDYIFANGTAITVEAAPNGTRVWYMDGSTKKYVTNNGENGEDLSGWYIFVGSNNADGMHNVNGSVTMTGGTVDRIYAGQSYGYFTGTSSITITGGSVNSIHCNSIMGSEGFDRIGTVTIFDATGATIDPSWGGKADNVVQKKGTTWNVSGNGIIPSGVSLTVNENETLTVPSGATLRNNGTLVNNGGTIMVSGQLLGNTPENYVAPSDVTLSTTSLNANVSTTLATPTASPDNTTLVPWFSYEIADAGTTGAVLNGATITPYGAGTVKVRVFVQDGYCTPIGKIYELPVSFTPVTGLSGDVPAECWVNKVYRLPTTVTPSDASYQTVVWSVLNEGSTGAVISGNEIIATNSGTATIRATCVNGSAYGSDFVKEYTVTFKESDKLDIGIGSVEIVKKDETTLTVMYSGFAGGSKEYPADAPILVTGTTNENNIVVSSGTADLILDNVKIETNKDGQNYPDNNAIHIANDAVVNLTLVGSNSIIVNDTAAIRVQPNAKLRIDGSGSLYAEVKDADTTNTDGAVIGSNSYENSGSITIDGGTLTIVQGANGAGIGSGRSGDCGSIIINGGTITATSALTGAAIGGGFFRGCGIITINGGTITATAYQGAAIGSGGAGTGGTVVIKGGNIQAFSTNGQAVGNCQSGSGVTVHDGNGNNVSLITITLNGAAADTAVSAVAGVNYGVSDVKTLDANKLYFYLPSGAAATSITAGGTEYICNRSFTYYTEHGDYSDATCTAPKTCTICGATEGEPLDHSYDPETHKCVCDKLEPITVNISWDGTFIDGWEWTMDYGTQLLLPTYVAPEGYTFVGYAESEGGEVVCADGESYTFTRNVTLYAIFEKNPVYYDLWVQGIQVSDKNASDILSDSTVTYDAATNTLYLNNTTITGTEIGIKALGDLNLHISGNNRIAPIAGGNQSTGIDVLTGLLTIDGTGSLTIQSEAATASYGILSGNLHVKGGIVTVATGEATISVGIKCAGKIATVTVDKGACLTAIGNPDGSFFGLGIMAQTIVNHGTLNTISLLTPNMDVGDSTEYLVVYGTVSLEENCPAMGFYHITQGAVLTIAEGVALDMSHVTADKIVTEGNIISNGTVILPDSYSYSTIPTAITGGTLTIGDSSYIWNGEKYICVSHVDADSSGYCDICTERLSPAVLHGKSLSLNGDIAINYYMDLSEEVLADEKAYMEFRKEDGTVIRVPLAEGSKKLRNTQDYYVFTIPMTSKEMADVVEAQFFWSEGSTETYTYSVKAYVDNKLPTCEDEALKDLLTAMLHYGAAAQTYFGYHTDRLANEGLEAPDYSSVNIEGFEASKGQATKLLSYYGASLQLNSKTAIRFMFLADPSLQEITASCMGEALEWTRSGNYISVIVDDISAKDLDEIYTLTVSDGTDTIEVSYSPMTYCRNVQNGSRSVYSPELKALASALYVYNQAANIYFGET